MKKFLKFILILAIIISLVILLLLIYYSAITFDIVLDESKLILNDNNAEVYDDENNLAFEFSLTSKSENINLSTLKNNAKYAFISVEDRTFYQHNGISFRGIARALVNNIKSFSFKEGASTISQQLIKNTHLSSEKTIKRKLKEIKLTLELEKKLSKDEILECYLNTVYFGDNIYGLNNASYYYFGKSAEELDYSSVAMLAGMLKSPNSLSPFKNLQKCKDRRNYVLNCMYDQGYITSDERDYALSQPLPESSHERQCENDYLKLIVSELNILSPAYSSLSNIKIYTSFDEKTQNDLENINVESDVAMTVIDNCTHSIIAFRSSKGNIARTPASTIKPLIAYAPAIEENIITPATQISDEKISFGDYTPHNYNDVYSGFVSCRKALSESLNIPAVKILNSIGLDKSCEYLKKLDMDIPEEDRSLTCALGGMKTQFTINQIAGAYSALADDGMFKAPTAISKIVSESGVVLYTAPYDKTRVFKDSTAYLVNDMLKTCAKTGTAKILSSLPFEVCAKTGTAGTKTGNTDAYTISYNSDITIGVWLGNSDNSFIDTTGGNQPCKIAYSLLKNYFSRNNYTPFPPCRNVLKVKLDKFEYENNQNIVIADRNAPVNECFEEIFSSSNMPQNVSSDFSAPCCKVDFLFNDGKFTMIESGRKDVYKYLINVSGERVFDGYAKDFIYCPTANEFAFEVVPYYQTANETFMGETILSSSYNISLDDEIIFTDWWNKFDD